MVRFIKWKLYWYTTKEVLPLVLILFLILTSLVFAQQVSKYSGFLLSYLSSATFTKQFLLSLIPGIIVITLPVALLLGTVVACSRLSSDGELTAAQSLGVSQSTLAKPFLILGLLGTIISSYLSAYVAPASLRTLKNLRAQILVQEANTRIQPHTFVTSFPNLLLYVQNVDVKTNDWLGVFMVQNDPENGISRLLTAERGQFRLESKRSLTLEAQLFNGMTMEYGSQRPLDVSAQAAPPTSQSTAVFEKSTVKLAEDENAPDDADRGAGNLNEMSLQELSNIVATAETERERRQATAEKHKRFAFPFACLTLTAMTFIMAIRGRRFSTRPRTVIAILFLAMGFYLLLVVGQNLALSGRVPVWLGVWFSNILYGSIVARSLSSSKPPFSSGFLTSLIASRPSAEPGGKPAIADSEGSDRKAAGRSVHRSNRAGSFNLINYLLVSEIVKYLALAAASLVVTSTIFTLFDLVPAIIKNGIPVSYAASYLGYLSPQLAYYVAPFSLLVALLMSFSVLSRSNQLVIIAGAGQSRMRFVAAVLFTSVALGVSLWAMANYVMPYTNREQDERYNRIKGRQIEQTTIAFGRKWVFGKNNNIYSYQRIEPDNTLVNASVYSLSAQQGLLRSTMHFSAASQVNDTTWQFDNGWLENVKADSTVERRSVQGRPERVTVEEGSGIFRRTTNESTKMSDWDLRRYIDQLNSVGMSTVDLQIDLKKRIAFPFSCLTLAILAIPFITAKGGRRSGPMISVAISVGIGLVFWLLTTFFEAAGKQENLPKDIAVWGPHILFVAIGLYLNFFRYRLQ